MNKSILIALIALLSLIALDFYLTAQAEHQRVLASIVRSLADTENHTSSDIWAVEIAKNDTIWRFKRTQENWFYPANENAFVLKDRFNSFLRDIVETKGTFVGSQTPSHFGFDKEALSVTLTDSVGQWNKTIQIGYSLPGIDTDESYMKLASNDTILHMHVDPNREIRSNRQGDLPPFIDPKILPSALQRRSLKKIIFVNSPNDVNELERIELEEQTERSQLDGPTYEWYANISGKRTRVVNASVYAFLSYLSRIQYTNLLDPTQFGRSPSRIILIDDEDIVDTLEVSTDPSKINVVRHLTTGHLYEITHAKATLLFPTPARLDTLPKPNPYQIVE